MNTFERNFGKCFILECAYTLECSKIYGVPKLLALQYSNFYIYLDLFSQKGEKNLSRVWFILKQMGITVPSLASVKKFQLPDMREPVRVMIQMFFLHVLT